MSLFREVVGACLCCCLPDEPSSDRAGTSHDLKRLSDWRAHPTLRQYDLEKHIADGGFSEVWLARSRSTGEAQCLKVVNLRKPGLRPVEVEILRGEARFLRLLDHPGLLRCRDAFETKYHLVMVLEYLSGGQMLDHLHQVDHYSEGQAARLFAQVASSVAYMHNLNIVHRDIKPENVMFARPVEERAAAGRPLRVKLIDMGMSAVLLVPETPEEEAAARLVRKRRRRQVGGPAPLPPPRREAPRGCLGSPGFIAPEIIHGGVHSLAMDVYALGVLLFAMLTGRKPWSLRDSRNLSYAERPISEAPGLKDPNFLSLSSPARELLLAMLADDPRVRPSCAAVLRHPFITQSLAAGGAALRQPPLDDVIKRRFAQLASLRRFRGLAFAMMASRQEGQDLADFTKQLTERRRELHRNLLTRAKTRRSLDLQHLKPSQQQVKELGATCAGSSSGAKKQTQQPTQQQQQNQQQPGKGPSEAAAAATGASAAAAPSPDGRLSVDSACSQQPLLLRQQPQQWRRSPQATSADARPSLQPATTTAYSTDDTSNHDNNQRNQSAHHHQYHHHHHQQQPQDQKQLAQLDSSHRSLDSLASSASSHQPLMAAGGARGGAGGCPPLPPSHYASHAAHWLPAGGGAGGSPAAAAASPAGGGGGIALGGGLRRGPAPQPPYDRSNSHKMQRHTQLEPVAEPGEGAGSSLAAAAARPAAGAAGASRGWSSSGRPPPQAAAAAATPPPRPLASRSRPLVARETELELAAADPLAILRGLPLAAGRRLGRSHSAPEDLTASLLGFGSSGGVDRGFGAARAGGGGGGPDVWLERLAMGADMRAVSANSWTLDLLENADLLLALTGVPLAQQTSSTTLESSAHGGTALWYGGGPVALPSVGAAAQRRSSDAARAQVSAAARDDASVHRQRRAVALLAAVRAGSSSLAAVGSVGGPASVSSGWPPRSAFAAAADTPTRPAAAAVGGGGAVRSSDPCWSPFTALSHGDAILLPTGSGLGPKPPGQPRALFAGCPTPPMRPSLDGPQPLLLPLPGLGSDPSVHGGSFQAAAAAAAGASPGEPLLLVRALRYGGEPGGGLDSAPSCDVSYTSLHLSASCRQLGVALPGASPAAAAAAATVAAAESSAGLAAAPEPLARRPSLALVDMDEHIAARRASLEESFHGGKFWFRMGSGAGLRGSPGGGAAAATGSPAAALAAAAAAADTSGHRRSGGAPRVIYAQSPGGASVSSVTSTGPSALPPGLHQELRVIGAGAGAAGSPSSPGGAIAWAPPSLARITECSDLGDPAVGPEEEAAAAAAARAPHASAPPPKMATPTLAMTGLPPRASARMAARQPPAALEGRGGGGGAAASSGVAPAAESSLAVGGETPLAPAPGQGAAAAVAPTTRRGPSEPPHRWRSPFEALSTEPIGG